MLEGGNNNEVRLRRQQQFMLVLAVAVILVVFMNRAEDQWFFASTTLVAPAGRTAAVYNGTLKSGNVTSEGSTSPRSLLVPPPPPPPPLFDVQSNVTCEEQNCMIENACIDRGLNRRNPIMIRFFGNNTVAFKKILVAHAAIGNHESNVVFGDVHETNALRIPAEIDPKSTAALAWRFVENCGHDLGDNAVGVLRLLKLFPEYMPENGTLSTLYVTGRSNYCDKVFSLLADEVKIVFHKSFRPPTLKCYRRIFFGLRGIGYMIEGGTWPNREATLERDMRAFRDLYYRNAGVDPTVKRDTLLVMEKRSGSHFSNLGNLTDLVANLTATFPSYRVIRATWSDYNMTEQVHLMSRTRAMISLPGSDIMNAIFLQDNSALVLYCRCMSMTHLFDTSEERKYWFDRVEYVDASTEACNSSNVSYWIDEAKGDTLTFVDFDSLKERLLRLGVESKSRASSQG